MTAAYVTLTGTHVVLDELLALRHRPATKTPASRFAGMRAGAKLSRFKGRGADFAEVRAYQPGDDVRTIDWRVTARKNKPHTKVFREERERPTLIFTDQTQSMFFGTKRRLKSVAAAEVAAAIAWETLANGDRVGGLVVGNDAVAVHKPFRSSKRTARMLADVARFNQTLDRDGEPTNAAALERAMLRVRRLARTNYRIYLVSDFRAPLSAWQDTVHALARHNQVVVVCITDPLDAELPPADTYTVADPAGGRLEFDTRQQRLRERYRVRANERDYELRAMCAHDAVRFDRVQTADTQLPASWL